MARSAGSAVQILAKEGDMVTLKLPSSEVRMVRGDCTATIGQVGNVDHELIRSGKAGRSPRRILVLIWLCPKSSNGSSPVAISNSVIA